MSKMITLEEFVARTKAELDAFADNWKKEHAKAPDDWPMEMSLGEWDEQFYSTDVCLE